MKQLRNLISIFAITAGITVEALCQATANAITDADDAFGTDNGMESVGIYNERSVRGFSLEAAGNYRVNGRYFVKSSGTSNFFIEKSEVRIGYNTFTLDLPGPSGVVDYRLRDPDVETPNLLTFGFDIYEQPFIDLLYQGANQKGDVAGALGASINVGLSDEQGGRGTGVLLAGTLRVNPTRHFYIQAFGGEYSYRRQSRFSVVLPASASSVPDKIRRGRYLGQDWSEERGQSRIAGLLSEVSLARGFNAAANVVFSQNDPTREFNQIMVMLDDRTARSSIIAFPDQRFTSYSGEGSIGWRGDALSASHDINTHVRYRASRNTFGGEEIVDAGHSVLGSSQMKIARPMLSDNAASLKDTINQIGFGFSWQLENERLRWNLGFLATNYEKVFIDANKAATGSMTSEMLYNAGAAYSFTPRAAVYGSYSRGLEEAGLAPATATNRNEVLTAGISTQRELGFRLIPAPSLGLIIAYFDTRKPLAAIDPTTGAFSLNGDVRHRGVEVSLSGNLSDTTTIVIGGVYTDASAYNAAIEAGISGRRPVSVPDVRGVLGANISIPRLRGLSLDVNVNYVGERSARSALDEHGSQLALGSYATADIGLRYRFGNQNDAWILRAQVLNLTDTFAWDVSNAETLQYLPQRSARIFLTKEF